MPDGVVLTGQVVGVLRGWLHAADGRWLAIVNYSLPRPGTVEGSTYLHEAVLPAVALENLPPDQIRR